MASVAKDKRKIQNLCVHWVLVALQTGVRAISSWVAVQRVTWSSITTTATRSCRCTGGGTSIWWWLRSLPRRGAMLTAPTTSPLQRPSGRSATNPRSHRTLATNTSSSETPARNLSVSVVSMWTVTHFYLYPNCNHSTPYLTSIIGSIYKIIEENPMCVTNVF